MDEYYKGQYLDRILKNRKMPSHDWCQQKVSTPEIFETIIRICEAEHNLIEAVNLRDSREQTKMPELYRQAREKVEEAREQVAHVYLDAGIARDFPEAQKLARDAQLVINNELHHESVSHRH